MSEEPYLITFGEILVGQVFESTQNQTFRYKKISASGYSVVYDRVTKRHTRDDCFSRDFFNLTDFTKGLRIFYIPTGRISIWI